MDRIQAMLQESIYCYREMLSVYARIRSAVASGGCAETLERLLSVMQELTSRAHYADARFQELFIEAGAPPGSIPLFSECRSLMKQVRDESLQVQQYSKAAMAVIHEELCRLKKGQQALSGYRSGNDARGQKINVLSG